MRRFLNFLQINFEFFCEHILNLSHFAWYRKYRGGHWIHLRCRITWDEFWLQRDHWSGRTTELLGREDYEGN